MACGRKTTPAHAYCGRCECSRWRAWATWRDFDSSSGPRTSSMFFGGRSEQVAAPVLVLYRPPHIMTGTSPGSPRGNGHDFLDLHESTRTRVESVPASACAQPGGLVPLGTRGAGAGPQTRSAHLPVGRLLGLSLVPRHGARELRERG